MSNPALEPEPLEGPGPQWYTVAADRDVHGHAPGQKFEMFIPPEQEALLLESGALKKARKPAHTESKE